MKIAIFTEGTILMAKCGIGRSREEIVQQVIDKNPSVKEYAQYVPVGGAAHKAREWFDQGAQIIYVTSRRKPDEIADIRNVLRRYNFPEGVLEYRRENEEYKDVAERIMPDILVEDDCESIGGEKEMTYPHIGLETRESIKSIIVKEFGGIDHLPYDIENLHGK